MSSALSVSIIRPPELRSVKSEAIVRFSIEYDHYSLQVDNVNTGLAPSRNVSKVAHKSCVLPELLMSLTETQ